LGAGVGTTGLSLNGTYQLNDNFNIRGIYATYDFTQNDIESGIAHQFDIALDTFSLLLDWHPLPPAAFVPVLARLTTAPTF